MKLKIIVGKDGRPSMGLVYNKMQPDSNTELTIRRRLYSRRTGNLKREYWRVFDNQLPFLERGRGYRQVKMADIDHSNSILIRWGNTIEVNTEGSIVYNCARAISRATDKKLSREILAEKGINVPKLVTPETRLEDLCFPIIARPRRHAKGRNFVVLNNLQEFSSHYYRHHERGWYYSNFVDKVAEYRVHCGHSRILNFLEKPNPGNGNIAWNRAGNGSVFTNIRWNDYNGKVAHEALKSVVALGLDFAGVDIMIDREGNPYVLELNTGPTLNSSEYSLDRYASYFKWLKKKETKREHWELKEFRNPKFYAWHEYHFEDREPRQRN